MARNFKTMGFITAIVVVCSMFFWCGCSEKNMYEYTLEISAEDFIMSLSRDNSNPVLLNAIEKAKESEQTGVGFIKEFGKAYKELQMPDKPTMAVLFSTSKNKNKIYLNSTDDQVIEYITNEYDDAIEIACNVIIKRMESFGVKNPTIQKDDAKKGILYLKLPGVMESERVDKLLTQPGSLEFWETYNYNEIQSYLIAADQIIIALKKGEAADVNETVAENIVDDDVTADGYIVEINSDSEYSIFNKLHQRVGGFSIVGPVIGYAKENDMDSIMSYINREEVRRMLPHDLVFAWRFKGVEVYDESYYDLSKKSEPTVYYELIALKTAWDGKAALNGDVVIDARVDFSQDRARAQVSMEMNSTGSSEWSSITEKNVGRSIAIVLDSAVYSYPTVQDKISGGRSQITGDFTLEEATDLANVLKAGKMTAPARIISKQFVDLSSK